MNAMTLSSVAGVNANDILNEAKQLLDEREWDGITTEGINYNLTTLLLNKDSKILKMVNNKHYNGNLQLVMPFTFGRSASIGDAKMQLSLIMDDINSEDKRIDSNGMRLFDYIQQADVPKIVSVDELVFSPTIELAKTIREKFDEWGNAIDTQNRINRIFNSLGIVYNHCNERITDDVAEKLNEELGLEKKKIVAGQKTSKVINRILQMSPCAEKYNRKFVLFSDFIFFSLV